jgi:hypothetical protein
MVMMLNAAFNNISAISWRSVLLVEETGVTGENHRQYENATLPVLSAVISYIILRYPWIHKCGEESIIDDRFYPY